MRYIKNNVYTFWTILVVVLILYRSVSSVSHKLHIIEKKWNQVSGIELLIIIIKAKPVFPISEVLYLELGAHM